MSLSDRQWRFTRDSALLTLYIMHNYSQMKAPLREVQRTKYQQEKYLKDKKTKTLDSQHLESLAEDRMFYVSGVWLGDWLEDDIKEYLQPIGDYWESLTIGNRWGGSFGNIFDPWHFEAA